MAGDMRFLKGAEKQSLVTLADRQGHPRIRLTVDSLGTPSMQFLDAAAHVIQQLPEAHQ
ncbi:MAG: hypothetical protein ACREND_06495 [Gemmatimonadaceae bacterium]